MSIKKPTKKPNGFPKTISVNGKKGVVEFQIKKFSKKALGEALTMLSPRPNHEVDYILAGEILLRDGFMCGSTLVLEEDKYITSASLACKDLVNDFLKEFELKKVEDLTQEEKKNLPVGTEYIIIVEDAKCYVSDYDRRTLNKALNALNDITPPNYPNYALCGEIILMSTIIQGSDMRFYTDDDFRLTVSIACWSQVEIYQSEVKKN